MRKFPPPSGLTNLQIKAIPRRHAPTKSSESREKEKKNEKNAFPSSRSLFQGCTMAHFTKCSPTHSIVRRAMLAVQDSMPFRLFSVHYLRAPSFISNIISVMYPLLKKKLIEKVSGGEIKNEISKVRNPDGNTLLICSFTSTTAARRNCTLT